MSKNFLDLTPSPSPKERGDAETTFLFFSIIHFFSLLAPEFPL
jgi:hypothetical protein